MDVEATEDCCLVDNGGQVCRSDRNLQGADMVEYFLKELRKEPEAPSLHSNSQSTIVLANNSVYHDRTRHIDVQYHFIRKML